MAGEENFKEELRSQDASRNLNQHEAAGHPHSWSLEMLLRRLRADHTKQDDKFANLLDAVGEFGTFQQRLVALTFIPSIMSAFFMFADYFVFTAQKPYCNTSWILAVGPNLSEAEQLNLTIPRAPNGSFLMCLMYLPVPWNLDSIIHFGLNDTDKCRDGWIYPDAKKRSLINEDRPLPCHPAVTAGADHLRLWDSLREQLSPVFVISLWHLAVSGGLRHQQHFSGILPESPRWLMMKGKVKEAKQMLCYAASVNKKTIPSNLLDEVQLPRKKVTQASVLDFCKNRQLRKVILVTSCVWFTVSYTYFTLSLRMRELGVSVHFRHVVPSIMEVSARLCCIFLLQQIGRKWSLAVTLLQTIIWCLLLLFLSEGEDGFRLRRPRCPATERKSMTILVLTLGEFSLAATVTVFFLYTAELLPTVLRATGLGLVFLASAAGAILSLTIINQTPSLLPIVLCCVLAIVAFSLSFLLPETQDQPLFHSLEHSPQMRNKVKDMTTEDTSSDDMSSDDMSEEAAKNVVLNAQILRLDPYPVSKPALEQ
ncbi:solute carrier family 22 member 14 isoform X6 [Trachypithecus francoisi]|uniref:solute carrier family 22 member 14 isoform X6 n=1 Tax=Trachypithecus francoisi TaxID=54180 RepID=UPI00141B6A16|nr:solute carrier family 22 member 14 isoform X6 [Trachypithecus francoisi]